MSEKKIVIVSDQLMHNIDRYRGELNRTEFVRVCIERVLSGLETEPEKKAPVLERKEAAETAEFVTRQEFDQFKQSMGKLEQEFMDFFIKYGRQLAGEKLSEEDAAKFSDEFMRLLQL